LEKIEMKKTLVAVAAMAAVTGAMADVTIYGTFEQAIQTSKSTTLAVDSGGVYTGDFLNKKSTGISAPLNGGSALGFKGSEDLGNGVKANFQFEMGLALDQNGGPDGYVSGASTPTYENRNSFVGLSGGFGSFTVGRQYNLSFYNIIGADPMGFSGTGGFVSAAAGGAGRTDNLVIYNLPSLVPGVNISVSRGFGEATTTDTSSTKAGDLSEWSVSYANGPLFVGFASQTKKGGTYANPFAGSYVTTTSPTAYTGTDGENLKSSSQTITYDLGMAKLLYGGTKSKMPTATDAVNGAAVQSAKGNSFGVSVPLGAWTVTYTSADLSSTLEDASTVKTKGTQMSASYALSKRTSVYYHAGKSKTAAIGTSASSSAIGLLHGF